MKLRLPGMLLSALLACTCAVTAATQPALEDILVETTSVIGSAANDYTVEIQGDYGTSWHVAATDLTWNTSHTCNKALNVGSALTSSTLSIIGQGTVFTAAQNLFIGGPGWGITSSEQYKPLTGEVSVREGATLEALDQLNVGSGGNHAIYGHKGILTVDGAGSKVIAKHALNIGLGWGGYGELHITNGGQVIVSSDGTNPNDNSHWSFLTVGYYEGSTGKIVIDGPNSSLKTQGLVGVYLGREGNTTSVIEVRNGATLDLTGKDANAKPEDPAPSVTMLGEHENSTAQIVIDGAGSSLITGTTSVGELGSGSIVASNGADVEVQGNLFVSNKNTGKTGAVLIDGADTTFKVKGDTYVGNLYGDATGTNGVMEVTNGAQLDVEGVLWVGVSGDAEGSVIVDEGSTLAVTGGGSNEAVVVGSGSELTVGTGSTITSDADITVAKGGQIVFEVSDGNQNSAPVVNVEGGSVNFADGSKVVYNLDKSLANSETGEFTLPSITGNVTTASGEMPETEVYGPDGNKMEGEGTKLERLPDGTYGLQVKIEQQAANNVLAPDAQRLVNTLWSSTGVVQEYGEAVLAHLNRPGSKNVWAMGLGSFQRMSSYGAATGYHYNGGGYAVGADTAVTENFNAGVSVGQMHGRHKAADGLSNVRQNSLMASLYGRYDLGRNKCGTHIMVDGYLGYGHTRNRARSWSDTNDEMITGRWGDDILALGFKGTWQRKLTDNSTIASFIGVRYLYGVQDDITMASANSSRDYYDGSMHNLSIPMGVTLRYYYAVGSKGVISPSLTVGYIADVYRENPSLRTKVLGNCTKFEGSDPGRHAFMMRLGVGYQIDERWYVGAGYNLEARSSDLEQGIDMNVSYSF